ncbi:MAG: 16S rRNA (cytidine(1402)-2'-O)-methyltransferase [Acidobacteria bacterium]|nr:16S rRNA (cytidine(1402)-2'-O)-methyltransferase [Acidobacteriota bacterium]
MPGTLFVVATPIGNLEDITARALRILREVAVIAAEDTRRTSHLLARYAITTPTTSLHEHNENQKAGSLVARLQRGEDIALVSDAGTPTISDPGAHLIAASVAAGVSVVPIPGANAAITALAVSAFPTSSFSFLGFPPTRSKDRAEWFGDIRKQGGTVVFYEAPHRIRTTLQDLHRTVGNCEVLVCRELTKAHEELVRGPILAVLERGLKTIGEFTVVVNIGQITDTVKTEAPSPLEMLLEIGEVTKQSSVSKRKAINVVAKRHNLRPNEVYSLIEKTKK